MLRVGLTGGLASGKSFVSREMAALGCHVIYADELGHAVLEPSGEAYAAVVAEFGPHILEQGGRIDRRRLGALVFGDSAKLARLSGFVHPPVLAREERLINEWAVQDPDGVAVVEAAILVETGGYRRFDKLVLTICRPEQQVERAMARDHLSREQAEARLAAQMPLEAKVPYADYLIDTSGTQQQTREQTHEVYRQLRSIAL